MAAATNQVEIFFHNITPLGMFRTLCAKSSATFKSMRGLSVNIGNSVINFQTGRVKMPAFVANSASQYFLMAEAFGMQEREGADLIEVIDRVSGDEKIP